MKKLILPLVSIAFLSPLYGCASSAGPAESSASRVEAAEPAPAAQPRRSAQPTQAAGSQDPSLSEQQVIATVVDARPAALVDGRVLQWGELRAALNEIGGATVLQEYVLDRALQKELADMQMTVDENDLAAEQTLLLESLSDDANMAVRLLDELRAKQGLGKTRFRALLARNAMLRALVQNQVSVTRTSVERMYDVVHGPKRQARLIVLPTFSDAQNVLRWVREGAQGFSELAAQLSTDSSASRGGLLEPISRADPAYPQAIRDALFVLDLKPPHHLSDPIMVENGYAVIMFVRELDGDGADINAVRPTLEKLVRLNQERLLMDQLARRLLTGAQVTVFDEALNESWNQQLRAR